MIWYRHWLELRATILALIGTAVLGSAYYIQDLTGGSGGTISRVNDVDGSLFRPLASLMGSLDAAQVNLVAFHAEFTWYAMLLLSWVLTGDGLRVFERWTNTRLASAAQFTLSLPISRRRIVITRIVSTYVVATLVLFVIAGTNAALFATTPYSVPLVQLLLASVFASLLVGFWSSMMLMLSGIVGPSWGSGVTLVAMLLSTPFGMYGMTASAAWRLEPALLVLLPVALGLVVGGAVATSTSEEA